MTFIEKTYHFPKNKLLFEIYEVIDDLKGSVHMTDAKNGKVRCVINFGSESYKISFVLKENKNYTKVRIETHVDSNYLKETYRVEQIFDMLDKKIYTKIL